MIFLTRFLASKSVTVILLLVIIGAGGLYFFTYRELQKANYIIKDQEQTIADKNAIISGYKSKMVFLQDNIREKDAIINQYAAKVIELNNEYVAVKERLDNIQTVNNVLRSKLNNINTTKIPTNNEDAIRKSNEMLDMYIFD